MIYQSKSVINNLNIWEHQQTKIRFIMKSIEHIFWKYLLVNSRTNLNKHRYTHTHTHMYNYTFTSCFMWLSQVTLAVREGKVKVKVKVILQQAEVA